MSNIEEVFKNVAREKLQRFAPGINISLTEGTLDIDISETPEDEYMEEQTPLAVQKYLSNQCVIDADIIKGKLNGTHEIDAMMTNNDKFGDTIMYYFTPFDIEFIKNETGVFLNKTYTKCVYDLDCEPEEDESVLVFIVPRGISYVDCGGYVLLERGVQFESFDLIDHPLFPSNEVYSCKLYPYKSNKLKFSR